MRWLDAYKRRRQIIMANSRMNGLGLSTSQTGVKSAVKMHAPLGNLGAAPAKRMKASQNPGAMTAPSSQGPIMPGSKQATGVTPKV